MKKQENGSFEGKLKTATLNLHLKLQPIGDADTGDNKPDFRAKIGSFEAGAGWNKISDNQNPYISVQIDAPEDEDSESAIFLYLFNCASDKFVFF